MNAFEQQLSYLNTEPKFHLYLAWACPFCHRILAALAVTKLKSKISITWMKNIKGPEGWKVESGHEPLFAADSLGSVYQQLLTEKKQRHSVPLLVELNSKRYLTNDSAEITRFVSKGFNGRYVVDRDIVPCSLLDLIEQKNQWLHHQVNRAVYLVGFATNDKDRQVKREALFTALDSLECLLSNQQYLFGEQLTESDLFLLATLERFDSVYYWLFKCNLKRLKDYPGLREYLHRLQQIEGITDTYNARLTVEHYYLSTMHVRGQVRDLNPSNTIPAHIQVNGQSIAKV